jgi:hypothetical protein
MLKPQEIAAVFKDALIVYTLVAGYNFPVATKEL